MTYWLNALSQHTPAIRRDWPANATFSAARAFAQTHTPKRYNNRGRLLENMQLHAHSNSRSYQHILSYTNLELADISFKQTLLLLKLGQLRLEFGLAPKLCLDASE
jgi:hypothetical protein